MNIATIEELSERLRLVATDCAASDSRLGYFAALYATMTGRVADGIVTGRFEDGARLERLACVFAARYLDALERYERGEATPGSWGVAFEASTRWRPIILQHLLLGMNAHINFDLGIAAGEVARDGGLEGVRRDFFEINAVLAELLEDVQERLASVSPWMGILDAVGGRHDEVIVNFSMRRARDAAWRVAERFAAADEAERIEAERDLDQRVARFARVVLKPGRLISLAAIPIRLRERASVPEVIAALGVSPR